MHVINVDIRDNHEEAIVGGRGILELANMLTQTAKEERDKTAASGQGFRRETVDAKVPEVLGRWQERFPNLPALWTVAYL